MICYLTSVKSSVFCPWAGWNRGYHSNVVLTSPVCKHAVDGEIGNFICWELCVGISKQWNCSLGSSRCFDGARIPGASRNRGIRLCHPCHSPGFISRKSGNETAFLPALQELRQVEQQTKRATVTDEMWFDTAQAAVSRFVKIYNLSRYVLCVPKQLQRAFC